MNRSRAILKRTVALGVGLLLWLNQPSACVAEHAYIKLNIFRINPLTDKSIASAKSKSDQEPPLGGVIARPMLKVKTNEPLVMQFIMTNAYPHGITKNVVVRYFVVPVDKLKQKKLPEVEDVAVVHGKFSMNFKPKCRVGARVAFQLRKAGVYILRVDTKNTTGDHEHFSAIDLQAE